jgi:Pyridoxamine 5'-phosphate oxidase
MTRPENWPAELHELFARSITAEFASLDKAGVPVTIPTTPYLGAGGTLDISTGVTYPVKAERARRNPRVCLLFADPIGRGSRTSLVAVVRGHAAVRDSDLQSNTDRYVRESARKVPDATKGQPRFLLRRMAFYYARIWVEVTPLSIDWWVDRSMEGPPQHWDAPKGLVLPESDPAPEGPALPPWRQAPARWRELAERSLAVLPLADLTTVDGDGYPLCVPVTTRGLSDGSIELGVGAGAPDLRAGAACLTLHGHPDRFTGQENHTFVGTFESATGSAVFTVHRALADWSLAGNRPKAIASFLAARRVLAPRLAKEAARRGQKVPRVRFD